MRKFVHKKSLRYVATVAVNGCTPAYVSKNFVGNNKRILERACKSYGRKRLKPGKSIEWDVYDLFLLRVVASGSFFSRSRRYVRYA